ncbi:MAG: DUF1835 domain-containing protein [Desulfovibrio sp.]|nr:MAG: DUF1835 domain-containing protein [Desulfovibrio sp.]
MADTLHITSGDTAGDILAKAGIPGDIFVWRDILYDGPRDSGWPSEDTLHDRALFLEQTTAGGLDKERVLQTLRDQYQKLEQATGYERIVLWFDACLFDQSMLAHILSCLHHKSVLSVDLICVDAFPGIEPFHGLGQLSPEQMASFHGKQLPVTPEQFEFAVVVDQAFATQNATMFSEISAMTAPPLPWVPAAVKRWLQEQPDPATGLGRLERLALAAIQDGNQTPGEIFAAVAAAETPPQYWGDITLWAKINGLAEREPPLVRIEGPAERLPQWGSGEEFGEFNIQALPT